MNGESLDLTVQNITRLKELFPEILTDGEKIDFDMLKAVLGGEVDSENERYQFTWHGKKKMIAGTQKPSKGTLRPDKEKSKNFDTTENLYIEGDNLEVLKLLQKSYNGKIKMIYIDPPYNTGKDFVYKDNFVDGVQNYLEQTGQVDSEGKILTTNVESNGRFHTDWLNMMYARLRIARNLLKEDGVIFISIDDSEQSNLKKLCDEIMGENNFVAQLIHVNNSSKNQAKLVGTNHEYCLVYAKNKSELMNITWSVPKNNIKEFIKRANYLLSQGISEREAEEELKQLVKYPRFYDFDHYYYVDRRGVYRTDNPGGVAGANVTSEIIHPITKKSCNKPSHGWRYKEETIREMEKNDMWHFGKDETVIPTPKRYLMDYPNQTPKSVLFYDSQVDSKILLKEKIFFDFPKPVAFIKQLLTMHTSSSDIILDFFSGSATTAHATMQLNAEDGGNRKFIMVQLPETLDEKSEAFKVGYRTICDIGEERIRRAGEKIRAKLQEKQQQANILSEQAVDSESLDIGFKVLKLDTSNIREWNIDFTDLEDKLDLYDTPFVENRSELDVVYEIMLKQGLELTYPINMFEVNGQTIYDIAFGSLFVCLSQKITSDIAQAIIARRDEHGTDTSSVIFRDAGFETDSDKLNCIEILKDAGYPEDNLLTL